MNENKEDLPDVNASLDSSNEEVINTTNKFSDESKPTSSTGSDSSEVFQVVFL